MAPWYFPRKAVLAVVGMVWTVTDPVQERSIRQPSRSDALFPLCGPALSIAVSLRLFGLDPLDGPVHVALIARAEPDPEPGGAT